MRVRLVVVATVDKGKWAEEYGCDNTVKAVRASARNYFSTLIRDCPVMGEEVTGVTITYG